MNPIHEDNRSRWNARAGWWRERTDAEGRWQRSHREAEAAFEPSALAAIREHAPSLTGRKACVIASGDNCVAFALAGMGAHVTSVDISDEQLRTAADRAAQLGLDMTFVRADVTSMPDVPSDTFDLVSYSRGMMVWLSDLGALFVEVERILRPGGYMIGYDVHPFQRPWADRTDCIEMEKPYWESGPFDYLDDSGGAAGGRSSHEYHWTLADILNALCDSGLRLEGIAEDPVSDLGFWRTEDTSPELLADWRHNPLAGLPAWLTLTARKET